MRVSTYVLIRKDFRKLPRALHSALRATMIQLGEKIHREFVPRHFLPSAPNRYRYKARTQRWNRRKKKRGGGVLHSGNIHRNRSGRHLRDLVLGGKRVIARAGSKQTRLTVRMKGTSYTPKRVRRFDRPDLQAEITRLASDEVAEIKRDLRAGVVSGMNSELSDAA